jgi:anti-anti-sigma factor
MNITVVDTETPTLVKLEGRLDTNTSPQLEETANALNEKGVKDIVVDMSACEFVSSAGLRVIVAMQKRAAMGGNLVFRGVVPEVMDVFEMTGFNNILTFE